MLLANLLTQLLRKFSKAGFRELAPNYLGATSLDKNKFCSRKWKNNLDTMFQIHKTFTILIFVFSCILFTWTANTVMAGQLNDYGLDTTVNRTGVKEALNYEEIKNNPTGYLTTKTGKIVGTVLSFIGVMFLLLMIYSGILWMTAAGNDTQMEKAKNLIMAAVVGLVVILSAYAITAFIGTELTSSTVQ